MGSANVSYQEIMSIIWKALHVKSPKKVASKILLSIGWRADWLFSKILRRKRRLTKQLARTLLKQSFYSSNKIQHDLKGFEWTPITDSVSATCRIFLEKVGSWCCALFYWTQKPYLFAFFLIFLWNHFSFFPLQLIIPLLFYPIQVFVPNACI